MMMDTHIDYMFAPWMPETIVVRFAGTKSRALRRTCRAGDDRPQQEVRITRHAEEGVVCMRATVDDLAVASTSAVVHSNNPTYQSAPHVPTAAPPRGGHSNTTTSCTASRPQATRCQGDGGPSSAYPMGNSSSDLIDVGKKGW